MSIYFFYLLRCNDGSLYAGITTDVTRRLVEHNSASIKASKYTRSRQPVKMVYQEKLSSRSKALKRKAEVKKWRKTQKEKLIDPRV